MNSVSSNESEMMQRLILSYRQHLRRTHVAPIQCRRCWQVMQNTEEMSRHVNADLRCEASPTQLEEGISQEKMLLINSKWGATWEEIFEVLFPGAPVPSPCK